MKLSKSKNKTFELKYQVQGLLSEAAAKAHIYVARLDRVNRNHEFGKEGYDQGAIDFRRTFSPKTFSVVKKSKTTDFIFEIEKEGCYELGELIGGRVFRKMYYMLKADGTWTSESRQSVYEVLEKEREIYERKLRKIEEKRLEDKRLAKEKRMKSA